MTSDQLHAAIMNLQLPKPDGWGALQSAGYKQGCRDARHAAAELVSAAWSARDSEVERLREALKPFAAICEGSEAWELCSYWIKNARAALSSQVKESGK